MEKYTTQEKIQICTEIVTNLKNFKGKDDTPVNLFNGEYSFVKPLKQLFKDYIHGDTFLKGTLDFVEIGKKIEYHFPLTKNHKSLFVIKLI